MDSTFDERRDAIKFASQKKIAQAHTADRQVSQIESENQPGNHDVTNICIGP
jgi:hypothetical protein